MLRFVGAWCGSDIDHSHRSIMIAAGVLPNVTTKRHNRCTRSSCGAMTRWIWARGALLDRLAEFVRLRQAMGEPAGVGAVAAPVSKLLHGHALVAARGVLPGEPHL